MTNGRTNNKQKGEGRRKTNHSGKIRAVLAPFQFSGGVALIEVR